MKHRLRIAIVRFTAIVMIREIMKRALVDPSKSQVLGSASRTRMLSNRAKIVVKASLKTKISTRVITGVGGICYLIVGINATNETIMAEIDTILACKSGS